MREKIIIPKTKTAKFIFFLFSFPFTVLTEVFRFIQGVSSDPVHVKQEDIIFYQETANAINIHFKYATLKPPKF